MRGNLVFLSRILKETDDLSAMELEALSWLLPEVQSLTDRLWMMSLERRRALAITGGSGGCDFVWRSDLQAVMMRCGFQAASHFARRAVWLVAQLKPKPFVF